MVHLSAVDLLVRMLLLLKCTRFRILRAYSERASTASCFSSLPSLTHSYLTSPFYDSLSGYTDTVFEGKVEQATKVQKLLKDKGFIPPDLVDAEVAWFYQ